MKAKSSAAVPTLLFIGVCVFLYLLGAFYNTDFNIEGWSKDCRALIAFLASALAPAAALVYKAQTNI